MMVDTAHNKENAALDFGDYLLVALKEPVGMPVVHHYCGTLVG